MPAKFPLGEWQYMAWLKVDGHRLAWRQYALLLMPLPLTASMFLAFRIGADELGTESGYFAAFVIYWAFWCLAFPFMLLGRQEFWAMFRKVDLASGGRRNLVILAFVPVAFTAAFALPIQLPKVTMIIVVASFAIAVVNAVSEEVLWRGTFTLLFGRSTALGLVFPALFFGIWHFVPQTIVESGYPGGAVSLVLFSIILGLCWGYVAQKMVSIRWTVVAHVALDFSGMGALFYLS